METKLIIPKKCKAGFNLRQDTYSGKLAYVIYNDGKVWRKENSWESWREKEATEEERQKVLENYDKNFHEKNPQYYKKANSFEEIPQYNRGKISNGVEPIEFDNIPTEGFVLNKKVGGYSNDWGSFRQAYTRVYDPRGFEFEITLPNLLFILQESNSIKGKGLEGEFVYSWDGKDLVLLPVGCPDYKKCVEYTDMQSNKVSAKTLIKGASYMTKKVETLIYMGRFDWYEYLYSRRNYDGKKTLNHSKKHIFVNKDGVFSSYSSISHLSNAVSENPIDNYAELMENLLKEKEMSKVVGLQSEGGEVIYPKADEYGYASGALYKKLNEHEYLKYSILAKTETIYDSNTKKYNKKFKGYDVVPCYDIKFYKDSFEKNHINNNNSLFDVFGKYISEKKYYTKEEIAQMNLQNLYVVKENGKKVKCENYF